MLLRLTLAMLLCTPCSAEIYRWDNGELIPGTEAMHPEPGVAWRGADPALSFADLSDANLTNATISLRLDNATFAGADLSDSTFSWGTLAHAILADANISRTSFYETSITAEQLYSTSSYKDRDLQGLRFDGFDFHHDFTDWDFSQQNLSEASLFGTLENADLTGAIVDGTQFFATNISKEQYASTDNYQRKDTRGIGFHGQGGNLIGGIQDLSGWDFSGHDLTGAIFSDGLLASDTDLHGAVLRDVKLQHTRLHDVDLSQSDVDNVFIGCSSGSLNLQGLDLSNVTFSNSRFERLVLHSTNLAAISLPSFDIAEVAGAELSNANLRDGGRLVGDRTTTYNRWTVFPPDFDPVAAGFTFEPSPIGDLNRDGLANLADLRVWVRDWNDSFFGDANLDHQFNSSDLVQVFRSGQYEDDIPQNSGWADGDWNGDGDFDSRDLVLAFGDGQWYEWEDPGFGHGHWWRFSPCSRSQEAHIVPEPTGQLVALVAVLYLVRRPRRLR